MTTSTDQQTRAEFPTLAEIEESITWLDNKYQRHGEDEDRIAANQLRAIAAEKRKAEEGVRFNEAQLQSIAKQCGARVFDDDCGIPDCAGFVFTYDELDKFLKAVASQLAARESGSDKWFVVTGNNDADTPILLFTSEAVARQFCDNNFSGRGRKIYKGVFASGADRSRT